MLNSTNIIIFGSFTNPENNNNNNNHEKKSGANHLAATGGTGTTSDLLMFQGSVNPHGASSTSHPTPGSNLNIGTSHLTHDGSQQPGQPNQSQTHHQQTLRSTNLAPSDGALSPYGLSANNEAKFHSSVVVAEISNHSANTSATDQIQSNNMNFCHTNNAIVISNRAKNMMNNTNNNDSREKNIDELMLLSLANDTTATNTTNVNIIVSNTNNNNNMNQHDHPLNSDHSRTSMGSSPHSRDTNNSCQNNSINNGNSSQNNNNNNNNTSESANPGNSQQPPAATNGTAVGITFYNTDSVSTSGVVDQSPMRRHRHGHGRGNSSINNNNNNNNDTTSNQTNTSSTNNVDPSLSRQQHRHGNASVAGAAVGANHHLNSRTGTQQNFTNTLSAPTLATTATTTTTTTSNGNPLSSNNFASSVLPRDAGNIVVAVGNNNINNNDNTESLKLPIEYNAAFPVVTIFNNNHTNNNMINSNLISTASPQQQQQQQHSRLIRNNNNNNNNISHSHGSTCDVSNNTNINNLLGPNLNLNVHSNDHSHNTMIPVNVEQISGVSSARIALNSSTSQNPIAGSSYCGQQHSSNHANNNNNFHNFPANNTSNVNYYLSSATSRATKGEEDNNTNYQNNNLQPCNNAGSEVNSPRTLQSLGLGSGDVQLGVSNNDNQPPIQPPTTEHPLPTRATDSFNVSNNNNNTNTTDKNANNNNNTCNYNNSFNTAASASASSNATAVRQRQTTHLPRGFPMQLPDDKFQSTNRAAGVSNLRSRQAEAVIHGITSKLEMLGLSKEEQKQRRRRRTLPLIATGEGVGTALVDIKNAGDRLQRKRQQQQLRQQQQQQANESQNNNATSGVSEAAQFLMTGSMANPPSHLSHRQQQYQSSFPGQHQNQQQEEGSVLCVYGASNGASTPPQTESNHHSELTSQLQRVSSAHADLFPKGSINNIQNIRNTGLTPYNNIHNMSYNHNSASIVANNNNNNNANTATSKTNNGATVAQVVSNAILSGALVSSMDNNSNLKHGNSTTSNKIQTYSFCLSANNNNAKLNTDKRHISSLRFNDDGENQTQQQQSDGALISKIVVSPPPQTPLPVGEKGNRLEAAPRISLGDSSQPQVAATNNNNKKGNNSNLIVNNINKPQNLFCLFVSPAAGSNKRKSKKKNSRNTNDGNNNNNHNNNIHTTSLDETNTSSQNQPHVNSIRGDTDTTRDKNANGNDDDEDDEDLNEGGTGYDDDDDDDEDEETASEDDEEEEDDDNDDCDANLYRNAALVDGSLVKGSQQQLHAQRRQESNQSVKSIVTFKSLGNPASSGGGLGGFHELGYGTTSMSARGTKFGASFGRSEEFNNNNNTNINNNNNNNNVGGGGGAGFDEMSLAVNQQHALLVFTTANSAACMSPTGTANFINQQRGIFPQIRSTNQSPSISPNTHVKNFVFAASPLPSSPNRALPPIQQLNAVGNNNNNNNNNINPFRSITSASFNNNNNNKAVNANASFNVYFPQASFAQSIRGNKKKDRQKQQQLQGADSDGNNQTNTLDQATAAATTTSALNAAQFADSNRQHAQAHQNLNTTASLPDSRKRSPLGGKQTKGAATPAAAAATAATASNYLVLADYRQQDEFEKELENQTKSLSPSLFDFKYQYQRPLGSYIRHKTLAAGAFAQTWLVQWVAKPINKQRQSPDKIPSNSDPLSNVGSEHNHNANKTGKTENSNNLNNNNNNNKNNNVGSGAFEDEDESVYDILKFDQKEQQKQQQTQTNQKQRPTAASPVTTNKRILENNNNKSNDDDDQDQQKHRNRVSPSYRHLETINNNIINVNCNLNSSLNVGSPASPSTSDSAPPAPVSYLSSTKPTVTVPRIQEKQQSAPSNANKSNLNINNNTNNNQQQLRANSPNGRIVNGINNNNSPPAAAATDEISRDVIFVCKSEKKQSFKDKNEIVGQPDEYAEVSILAACAHPNITAYVDQFEDNDYHHLVMEYVDGGDLKDEITRRINNYPRSQPRHFQENLVMHLFVQMCLGIEYLHRHNIMHRDLKTRNILLSRNWIVKVCDFGFSKKFDMYNMAGDKEITYSVVGSPYWMSPSVVQKKPYSQKADVWSLGVLLYEMLSLKKPFNGDTTQELAMRIVTEPPEPLRRLGDGPPISRELTQLVGYMLQKDEAKRPTVRQILQVSLVRKYMEMYIQKYENLTEKFGSEADRTWLKVLYEHQALILSSGKEAKMTSLKSSAQKAVERSNFVKKKIEAAASSSSMRVTVVALNNNTASNYYSSSSFNTANSVNNNNNNGNIANNNNNNDHNNVSLENAPAEDAKVIIVDDIKNNKNGNHDDDDRYPNFATKSAAELVEKDSNAATATSGIASTAGIFGGGTSSFHFTASSNAEATTVCARTDAQRIGAPRKNSSNADVNSNNDTNNNNINTGGAATTTSTGFSSQAQCLIPPR